MEADRQELRQPRYRRRTRRSCCSCRLANYSLLILGIVEAFIIIYYVITIIVVSYIYGKYYVPNQDQHRRYWTSLLAVRYFVLFSLFGFPVSLMTRKCRPMVIYGIKNVIVAAYALTSSIFSVVILTTPTDVWASSVLVTRSNQPTKEDDPVLRTMEIFGVVDSVVNALCALAEVGFIYLACNLADTNVEWVNVHMRDYQPSARSQRTSSGDILGRVGDSAENSVASITYSPGTGPGAAAASQQSARRNAMTNDIVAVLLGKV